MTTENTLADALRALRQPRMMAGDELEAYQRAATGCFLPTGQRPNGVFLDDGTQRMTAIWKEAIAWMCRRLEPLATAQAGWKWVPVEPTKEMERQGLIAKTCEADTAVTSIYRAILDAAPVAVAPSDATGKADAEFLSKRLARVAKLTGAHIPDHFTHEQVAECAGTILGDIARKLESATGKADGASTGIVDVHAVAKQAGFVLRTLRCEDGVRILTGVGEWDCYDVTEKIQKFAALLAGQSLATSAADAKDAERDFARGAIAALAVMTSHGHPHGSTYHDDIVRTVGEKVIYSAAEDDDYAWAGLNPRKKPKRAAMAASRKDDGK
jgi:hypothetical protein